MNNPFLTFLDRCRQDLVFGLRGLARNPGYTVLVVLTLALGIGANSAIFSVVDGVLLRPLPYRAPDRVVVLHQAAPRIGEDSFGFSVPDFRDFRERTQAFSALAEYHSMWFILLGRAEPERVQTGVVSDNFFDLLGVKPLLGRTFRPGEDKQGAAPVLLLSYHYWRTSFGGDPKVIGKVFRMNDKPHTVVGVLPPLPAFPNKDEIFMPAGACPFRDGVLGKRDGRIISHVFARLKDGVTPAQALSDVRRVSAELAAEYPQNYPTADGYTVRMESVAEAFTGRARTPLFVLLATSIFVLLIACANVANLALSRLVLRERELAMRAALGASRGRLLQQLITENLLLALLGGTVGLGLAWWGLDALKDYAAPFLPRVNEIGMSTPVLLFTAAVSLFSGLLFGSWPRLPRAGALAGALKDGARGAGAAGGRLRGLLIVGQVAISVPLLAGATLAARSLFQLQSVDPGVDTEHVLTANLSLNFSRYDNFEKRLAFWDRSVREVEGLPGVESVAVSGSIPLHGLANHPAAFAIEHRDARGQSSSSPAAQVLICSDGYFKTVGEPLLRGRAFNVGDSGNAPAVAIVNQSLASHFWPAGDPVGQRISFDDGRSWITITGVVANARQQINLPPADEIYLPLRAGHALTAGALMIRTHGAPGTLGSSLRAAIRRVDPQQPVTHIQTLAQVRSEALAPPRLLAILLGLFALLALVITAAGIGGVLAFSVNRRTQEIGIRMALGASRSAVLQMVLRQGLTLVVLGLVGGTIAALFLVHLMRGMLYDVSPADPLTFIAVVIVLLSVAILACLLPARRATQVDPMIALRAE